MQKVVLTPTKKRISYVLSSSGLFCHVCSQNDEGACTSWIILTMFYYTVYLEHIYSCRNTVIVQPNLSKAYLEVPFLLYSITNCLWDQVLTSWFTCGHYLIAFKIWYISYFKSFFKKNVITNIFLKKIATSINIKTDFFLKFWCHSFEV